MNLPTTAVIDSLIADFNLTRHMISPARDRVIMLPDERWIAEFAPWLWKHAPNWAAEMSDCDDISRWAQVQACVARASAAGPASGNAVFVATISGVPGRMLNGIWFTDQYYTHDTLLIYDNKQTPWFVEPQTGAFCHAKPTLVENIPDGAVGGVDYVSL